MSDCAEKPISVCKIQPLGEPGMLGGAAMKSAILAAAVLMLFDSPVLAGECPVYIVRIDAALAAGTSLSDSDLAKVKVLRDKGYKLHRTGRHRQSVETLAQAKAILGIP